MGRQVQWYESLEGRRRLQLELDAIARFNAPRPAELRLVGRQHRQGHLIVDFAFRPLDSQPLVVRGEMILSAQHPEYEPAVRIRAPDLAFGKHLLYGEALRSLAQARTIPLEWTRAGHGLVLCLFDHKNPRKSWTPDMTVVSVVLHVQGWFLNYWVWRSTGRWPYEGVA
jgi:hypothetical protein